MAKSKSKSEGIHLHGMVEFQQALATLVRQAENVLLRVTSESVANRTIEAAQLSIPIISGAASNSLVTIVHRNGASVQGGGPGVPYYGWLEFGGESGIGGSNVREYVPEGRYLLPAFQNQRLIIEFELNKELKSMVRTSGLEVT